MILLIHPPVAKPSEPPAGVARLSGLLEDHNIPHRLLDANLEGLLHLMGMPAPPERADDRWTKRAVRNRDRNLSSMRDIGTYRNIDRYKRAVKDLTRALAMAVLPGARAGLANYEEENRSPLRSEDLIVAAEQYHLNPFFPYFSARLEALFQESRPLAVGISLNFLSQALSAFAMIGFIRRRFPTVKVIMGGGLVTSWLRNPEWRTPFDGLVDHLVAGPGEDQLFCLLGLTRATGGLPRPSYQGLPQDHYLSPGFVLPYAASSGCPWGRCAFCPEKAEGNPYLPVPVPQVLSDLETLVARTAPALIHLLDNAVSPALLKALAANGPGVPWYGFARVGSYLADPDFCQALRNEGCVMLKLGIESGDQGVLDALEKGINIETTSLILRNLKKAGIATYVYLLFGTPPEKEESARKTLEFSVRHSDFIDFLNLAIFNLPLCGAAASGLMTKGFSEGDLSLYTDFVHPAGWDRRRVRTFLDRTFKVHPAISPILRSDPPIFTSNHAPFFARTAEFSFFDSKTS